MITEDKVIELFCMADNFCKFFDVMIAKYTLKPDNKRKHHRSCTMSKAEIMLILVLFHDSGYHCFKHFYKEKVAIPLILSHTGKLNVFYHFFIDREKSKISTCQ